MVFNGGREEAGRGRKKGKEDKKGRKDKRGFNVDGEYMENSL